ncbi:MAG: right-handed parallel beta-helix repeat-containing protein [Chitinivibrionales bacterium]|nr:right-handed parallel beta-helix repeat-containing protein [Chitinivibrionales bacterium]
MRIFMGFSVFIIMTFVSGQALTLSGLHDTTLSGLTLSSTSGDCISMNNCQRVRIVNCLITPCAGEGISLTNCSDITIVHNKIMQVRTGVYPVNCQNIVVDSNFFRNVQGPMPRGQYVQFNTVNGGSVSYNIGENLPGQSNPEDAINMYKSNGTAAAPIRIIGNKIRGGGPSTSGGGIMNGDDGGSYTLVQNNTIVDPGQYGIAIASGNHIQVINNKVYARQQSFTNVGIYVWNQYSPVCDSETVQDNQVNWTNSSGAKSGFWDGGNCGTITMSGNNWSANIDASILPADLEALYGGVTAIRPAADNLQSQSQTATLEAHRNATSGAVEFKIKSSGAALLRIYDITGAMLWANNLPGNNNVQNISWSGRMRSGSGMYLARLEAGSSGKTTTLKIMIW